MLQSGRLLLFLGLCAQVFALNTKAFENTAVVRTVDLGGAIVHVTTTYAIRAVEAGLKTYTVAIDQDENDKTSWLEAKIKGQPGVLDVKHHVFEASR
jgi:oligosaccharyltransferase complex subunit alpha (ribophorin I)